MVSRGLFEAFAVEIHRCSHLLTEDSIRYAFFSCLLRQDPDLNHYILELPYQRMDGAGISIKADTSCLVKRGPRGLQELDLYYSDGAECCCIEFKFHRTGDSHSAFAHTDAAGSMFNDLRRLQLIVPSGKSSVRKLFVYVTDGEMDDYLGHPVGAFAGRGYRRALNSFYCMPPERDYVSVTVPGAPATFTAAASQSFSSAEDKTDISINGIRLLFSYKGKNPSCQSFKEDGSFFIKVFEVL